LIELHKVDGEAEENPKPEIWISEESQKLMEERETIKDSSSSSSPGGKPTIFVERQALAKPAESKGWYSGWFSSSTPKEDDSMLWINPQLSLQQDYHKQQLNKKLGSIANICIKMVTFSLTLHPANFFGLETLLTVPSCNILSENRFGNGGLTLHGKSAKSVRATTLDFGCFEVDCIDKPFTRSGTRPQPASAAPANGFSAVHKAVLFLQRPPSPPQSSPPTR
ncbi:Protein of unknown function, partial [Gryllus bimaculatus]